MYDIKAEYLAGLIDGEGYLALIPSKVMGLRHKSFEPVIKIGMTGEDAHEIFKVLNNQFGGNIEKRKNLTKGGRIAYTYILKSRVKVKQLLIIIYPELIIKRKQAKLLLEFCDIPMTHSRHVNFDETALKRKVDIYIELKDLKLPEPLAETN